MRVHIQILSQNRMVTTIATVLRDGDVRAHSNRETAGKGPITAAPSNGPIRREKSLTHCGKANQVM